MPVLLKTNRDYIRDIRRSIHDFLKRAKTSEGLQEVARRYARNLADARWLWRNRTIASDIQVSVAKTNSEGSQSLIANFNALKISKIDFDKYHADEIKVR